MLLRADARAKREQGCVPRPGADCAVAAQRRAASLLRGLDAEVLGGGRDPGALLLGRRSEPGGPAEVEHLPGGGETLADHGVGGDHGADANNERCTRRIDTPSVSLEMRKRTPTNGTGAAAHAGRRASM